MCACIAAYQNWEGTQTENFSWYGKLFKYKKLTELQINKIGYPFNLYIYS